VHTSTRRPKKLYIYIYIYIYIHTYILARHHCIGLRDVNGTTIDRRRIRKYLEKSGRSRIQDVVQRLTERKDEISKQLPAIVSELELIHDDGKKQKKLDKHRCCLYSFELLMMGGGTAGIM